MSRRRFHLRLALAILLFTGPVACQKSFDDRLAEARQLQEQGDFATSIDRLRELASEQPDQAEVSYRLGLALASTGEVSASLWPLRKAAESPEYAVDAGLLASRLLQQSGNYAEAVSAAEGVLAVDPENETALSHLGRAQILAKQLDEGLATADRILAADASNARAHWLRAAALSELERYDEAVAAFGEMRAKANESGEVQLAMQSCSEEARLLDSKLERAKDAMALLESCVAENPGAVDLVRSAAQLAVENDEPARAEKLWRDAIEVAPDALALRVGLAQHLASQEDWDGGIAVLTEAVEEFGTIEASTSLADLHLDRKDYGAAEAVLAAAAESLGDSDAMRFQRADLLLEKGDLDGAEALGKSIEDPTRRDVVLGRVQFFRGDAAAAIVSLERALERWPDNSGVRYVAGRAYQAVGDHERAIEEYRQAMRADLANTDAALAAAYLALALGDPAEAYQYAAYHVKGRPYRNAEPYVIGARAAMLAGLPKQAGELLDHLASQEGGLPAAVAERARLQASAGETAAAISGIDSAGLDLAAAENEEPLKAKCELLIAADRADEALAASDAALAAQPDALVPLVLRAQSLHALGRDDDAREAADRALAASPDAEPAGALAVLAQVELDAGRIDEAIGYYDRAAAADETDIESPYRAAQLEFAAGRNDAAKKRLSDLLAVAPAHVGACNDLAYLLAESGEDLDRALALAQRAVRLSKAPAVIDTLATVRIARGEADVAQEILEKGIAQHPDSGTLHYRLGVALERGGDREAALGAFRKALEGDAFAEKDAAEAEIARLESAGTVQ